MVFLETGVRPIELVDLMKFHMYATEVMDDFTKKSMKKINKSKILSSKWFKISNVDTSLEQSINVDVH